MTGELKSRVLNRHLPICTFDGCDWNPATKDVPEERRPKTEMRRETAIRRAADHAVTSGHVMVEAVKVRRIREVVREERVS